MIIDATSCFTAKYVANTMQRDVGKNYKVEVIYSANDNTPYDWYDIEFSLINNKTGEKHEVPNSVIGV
tara:strand:+ start:261 stop:464 length:204 start_codon:yes stop_codon:yes gene_type:complete